jgi:hypothetical protein
LRWGSLVQLVFNLFRQLRPTDSTRSSVNDGFAPASGEPPPFVRRSARFSKVDLAVAFAIAVGVGVLCLPYLDATFLTLRDSAAHTPDEGTILYDAARIARGHAP